MVTILELPFPPALSGYFGVFRGRKILSKRGREYKKDVQRICMLERVKMFETERLEVCVMLYPPTRRKCDLDNYMKALLDALQAGGAYADDSQIDKLIITRGPVDKDGPGVVVSICEIGEAQQDIADEIAANLGELLATALHTSEVAH